VGLLVHVAKKLVVTQEHLPAQLRNLHAGLLAWRALSENTRIQRGWFRYRYESLIVGEVPLVAVPGRQNKLTSTAHGQTATRVAPQLQFIEVVSWTCDERGLLARG